MQKIIRSIFISSICLLTLILFNFSYAQGFSTNNPEIQRFIQAVAKKYNYSPNYVSWVISQARYNPEVISRMEQPYEEKPWDQYEKLFVTPERINEGVKYWDRSNKLLAWEEREYAVPSDIILAIIGVESKYGEDVGHFRVLDALTTLAFHYPPRAKFFQKELASFIALTQVFKVRPESLYGSYAGAMGQCQFMPSSYLHYAVDFHGQNKPNLYRDKADIIFSVGNYLRQNGWEPNQPILARAEVKGTAYKRFLVRDNQRIHEPTIPLSQLARYGIHAIGDYDSRLPAQLVEFQGANGPEYWLAFHNFYVITTYNSSSRYAMAVYKLGYQIQQAYSQQKAARLQIKQQKQQAS